MADNAAYEQELDRWERETGEHRDSYPLDRDEIERMANGASRDECSPELDRVIAALERIAAPKRPDGTYNLSREACEQIAREALRHG